MFHITYKIEQLKLYGNHYYHPLQHLKLCTSPSQSILVFVVILRTNIVYRNIVHRTSLENINRLVFLMEAHSVLCKAETEF